MSLADRKDEATLRESEKPTEKKGKRKVFFPLCEKIFHPFPNRTVCREEGRLFARC